MVDKSLTITTLQGGLIQRAKRFATWLTLFSMLLGSICDAQVAKAPATGGKADPSLASLNDDAAKYQALLNDPDVASDKDIQTTLFGKWVETTCQGKRLQLQQLLGNDSLGASVYSACTKRLTDQGAPKIAKTDDSNTGAQAGDPPAEPNVPPPAGCATLPSLAIDFVTTNQLPPGPSPMQPSPPRFHQIQLNATSSGAEIYTKSKVWLGYINRLRYTASLGGTVTAIATSDIPTSIFVPGSGGTTTKDNAAAAAASKAAKALSARKTAPPASPNFVGFQRCLADIQAQVGPFRAALSGQEQLLNNARQAIIAALDPLQAVVASVQEAKAAANTSIFLPTQVPAFPIADIRRLDDLMAQFTQSFAQFSDWATQVNRGAEFDATKTAADALAEKLDAYLAPPAASTSGTPNPIAVGSKEVSDYEDNRAFLNHWLPIFQTVATANDDYFIVDYQPVCGGWFGQGTSTQMQLTIVDNYKPAATNTPINLDKIVCQPAITITNGLGLSFIPDQTPAFVPSPKKDAQGNPVLDANGNQVIVQSLGYSSTANVRPAYAMLVNAAVWSPRSAFFELHLSAGAMLTAATGGATTDILIGPSMSFLKRAIFVSPMYDLGLRTQYLNQFPVGSPQGSLTTPPTHQVWKSGFGLSITFPLSPGTKSIDSSTAAGAGAKVTPPPN